jgi:hypothetical protein
LLTDDLSILDDKDLAKWHAEAKGRFEYEVLAEQEWKRRGRTQELTLKPPKPWHETFIGKVIVSVVAGIILLFFSLWITRLFISTPQQPTAQKPSTQGTAK